MFSFYAQHRFGRLVDGLASAAPYRWGCLFCTPNALSVVMPRVDAWRRRIEWVSPRGLVFTPECAQLQQSLIRLQAAYRANEPGACGVLSAYLAHNGPVSRVCPIDFQQQLTQKSP
jgi:hypothetical protein